MPLTVPNIIKSYARGGGSIAFMLDIEPSAVDTWTMKRFATAKMQVDGDTYDEATLGGLAKIGFEAKVIQGGNVATLPDVDVKLLNKAKLHEEFVTDIIEGRRAVVRMTAIGPNICLNSSFEKRTGADFENWTETPGAGGGTVTAETGTVYDGATACKLTGGTAGSYIISDAMIWRIGSKVIVSCYARTSSGTATVKAALQISMAPLFAFQAWYNATTKAFGLSRVKNSIGVANATEWQRFSIEMDWKDFYAAGSGAALLVDQPFFIELWCEPGENAIVDAVQIELNNQLTPYNHNRYELVAADVCTVFTGIVKNPEWSADQISISLEAWDSNKHRDIPKTILTDATDATWTVPRDSMGKPFPMTYGDFNASGIKVWNWQDPYFTDFARGLLANIEPEGTGGILAYFDRPGMLLYKPGGAVLRLYHFCKDDNRYYEQMYNDATGYTFSSPEFIDDFASHPRWKMDANATWAAGKRIALMATLKASAPRWNDSLWGTPLKACDGWIGIDSYASYPAGSVQFSLGLILETFPFNADTIIRRSDTDYDIYVLGDFTSAGPAPAQSSCNIRLATADGWIDGCDWLALWTNQPSGQSWRNTPARYTGNPAANKKLTEQKFNITDFGKISDVLSQMHIAPAGDHFPGSNAYLRVWEAGMLIYFNLGIESWRPASQLYGRTFGTTWNGRKAAANMVESAPEVIESIIREELGAVDADINETLFDAADTARPQAAAGQLHEIKNSMDVIKGICKEFGLLYNIDILGRHTLINLDWRPVTKHLFLHDWYKPFENVKISYTPRSEIVNDIILHYDRNQFTGDYRKVAFCNKDACSGSIGASYIAKCAASYAELGNKVQAVEINCDWIKSTATAEAMVQWTIDWLYKQRLIISGDLFLDNMDFVFGDIADVDLDPLLPKSFTSTARFMAMAANISRTNSRMAVKLLEVKEP